jgi:hypothetical protein
MNTDQKLLNELNIDITSVNKTHEIDQFDDIKYKFGEVNYYPNLLEEISHNKDSIADRNWEEDIRYLIENILEDNTTYSIAVLGSHYEDGRIDSITFGEHLLVTNKTDVDGLIIYLEGQIDSSQLSIESGKLVEIWGDELRIQFKYRVITISREVFELASKIKHSEKLETKEPNHQRI